MSECERARARVCDLITKGLQQALLVVHTPPPSSLRSAWRSYRPYRYEIVIGMQSDDSDTASGHMAAQQATSPVPPTRSPVPELILISPATPVLSTGAGAQDMLNVDDLTLRRAQPDVPF